MHEVPDRTVAHHHTPRSELCLQSPQGQRRIFGQPRKGIVPARRHHVMPPSAHRFGRRGSRLALPLRPLHRRGHAHPEYLRRVPHRLTRQHEQRNALPQIVRIGLHHPCWTSPPVRRVNHKPNPMGIPRDSDRHDPALVEKAPDADLLREMISYAAERLMELEVGAVTGAAYGIRTQAGWRSATAIASGTGRPGPEPSSSASRSCGRAATSRASLIHGAWPQKH